jgi:ABC-type bacteriocin/lantibiotic exporter with double-glycine peptidase domain
LMAGSIIAISMYLNMILGAINTLTGLITKYETLNVTLEKISDIVCEPSEEESEASRSSHTVELEGKIEFDRVSFKYEENLPWVLQDISFSIYPNQTVAIVGKSGCGKTTLAKILVGLLEPTAGRVLLDNFDRHFMSLKSLRDQVGYLPQHNHLFAGSIKDNITFNSDHINSDRLNFSSEVANAKDFIFKFPTNFDQYLAEGGLGLSGGEKQRLALARLIYQDPKIIVMDESTSALDTASEMAVLDTIEKVLHNKTVLIIAHRLSTIKNADLILVMENGEIVEQGSHQDLVKKEGYYLKLFENQIALGEVI